MAVYKRGDTYWYEFVFNGERVRESTKQGNKRVAEQMEAARKTQLAKGEVGIQERKPVPTFGNLRRDLNGPFRFNVRKSLEPSLSTRPN